jgi:hypothetical protein
MELVAMLLLKIEEGCYVTVGSSAKAREFEDTHTDIRETFQPCYQP